MNNWAQLVWNLTMQSTLLRSCRAAQFTTLFLDRLNPLSSWPVLVHILWPETDNCFSWICGREIMTKKNISWSIPKQCRPRSDASFCSLCILSRNMKHIRVFYLKIFSFWRWNFLYIWIGVFFVMANSADPDQTSHYAIVNHFPLGISKSYSPIYLKLKIDSSNIYIYIVCVWVVGRRAGWLFSLKCVKMTTTCRNAAFLQLAY